MSGRVRQKTAKPKNEVIDNLEEDLEVDDAIEEADDAIEEAEETDDILEGVVDEHASDELDELDEEEEEEEEDDVEQNNTPATSKNLVKYRKLGGGILSLPGGVVVTGVEGTEFTYEKDAIPIAFRDLVVEVN